MSTGDRHFLRAERRSRHLSAGSGNIFGVLVALHCMRGAVDTIRPSQGEVMGAGVDIDVHRMHQRARCTTGMAGEQQV